MTFWSPNINIFRDPRWGRGHETYGEDPYLTKVGSCIYKGNTGDDEKYLKAAACAKHYAVHSGPESERHSFNAVVSEKIYVRHISRIRSMRKRGKGRGCHGSL